MHKSTLHAVEQVSRRWRSAVRENLIYAQVAANDAAAAAEAAAAEIASLAPLVQRAAKAMMRGRRGKDGRFMADARYQECFDSRDYQEGLKAFAEGRDPVFNGS